MPLPELQTAVIPEPVLAVIRTLKDRGHHAYLVGGCVRDMVLGNAPKDFDVASSATPEQVIASFRKVIPTGIQHGTVTVMSSRIPVEVTTFRSDGDYHDGRRPSSISFHSDIGEDLSRRDFTVNAMAFDPIGRTLEDPFHGQRDLKDRIIRCVGVAATRFSEDGLRILRAVRFATVLGFRLDPETESAITPAIPVYRKVAMERVREEFVKLLLSPRAREGLELLVRTQLLPEILAPITDLTLATLDSVAISTSELEIRLACLLADGTPEQRRQTLERLKFPVRSQERVLQISQELPSSVTELQYGSSLRRQVARLGLENLAALRAAVEARCPIGLPGQWLAEVDSLLASPPPLVPKDLALTGQDVMKQLAVTGSPLVGEAIRFLMALVLEEPALNTREALSAKLAEWQGKRRVEPS